MRRQVVLHIGSPKTGTSTIQVTLARLRHELSQLGCTYPTDDEVERASKGMVTAGNAIGMAKLVCPDLPHRVSADAWLARFRTELASPAIGDEQLLYSSEYLWFALEDRMRELSVIIGDAGWSVRIIAYVRPQDDFVISQYSQLVKRHHQQSALDDFAQEFDMRFLDVLDMYAGIFGAESMRVRVFDPQQFLGGDLFADFSAQLELASAFDESLGQDRDLRVNPRLSLQESETMRLLNRFRVPVPILLEVPEAYRRLHTDRGRHDPLALSAASAALLGERFRDENAQLRDRYLIDQELNFRSPVSRGRCFPPPSRSFALAVTTVASWMYVQRRFVEPGLGWVKRNLFGRGRVAPAEQSDGASQGSGPCSVDRSS